MNDAHGTAAGHVNEQAESAVGLAARRPDRRERQHFARHRLAPMERLAQGYGRVLRHLAVVCLLGFGLSACDGSNAFEPCDPNGDTPHTPCEVALE